MTIDFTDKDAVARALEASRGWTPEQRGAFLNQLESAQARERILTRYSDVTDLAVAVDPTFQRTPALQLIGKSIEIVLHKPNRNLLITMPPQEGKSTLTAVYCTLRALQLNPNRKIILASYGDDLAHSHSRRCRDLIDSHGTGVLDAVTGALMEDKIGLRLQKGNNKVSGWGIDGGEGSLTAAGIGASITGKPADLFIIDDPYKNMVEADSITTRRRVDEWFASVVTTRLSPAASIILIQTRWHPEDLAGKVLAAEATLEKKHRSWRHINIPAIAEEGIPDALGRKIGEPMQSARDGYDDDGNELKRNFPDIRRKVGERVWYALYQGSPRNPAGGLFMRAWFDDRRFDAAPILPIASIVSIDPADSGEGDETGIIGASLTQDGTIVLTEDWSAQMTSDQWSRQAVMLALQLGAREISMEGFATYTTYEAVVKRAWQNIHKAAVEKHNSGALLTPIEQRALAPYMPFVIHKWTAKGDAVGRAALLRQACEVGSCRTVENKLAVFEDQACDWQAGQHQPDRVAAAIIAHDRLAALAGGRATLAQPVSDRPANSTPAWLRRRITDPHTRN